MMGKVLIFGASGQDSSILSQNLTKLGYEVYGVSKSAVELKSFKKVYKLDKLHEEAVVSIIANVRPEYIYNLAGPSSVHDSFENPQIYLDSIIFLNLWIHNSVRKYCGGCRIFFAGSSECFGNTPNEGASELTEFKPVSPYGIAKSTAIQISQYYRETFSTRSSVGILFNHESAKRGKSFVTKKIVSSAVRIASGQKDVLTLGNVNIFRDWSLADEVVCAIKLINEADEPGDFVVGGGTAVELKELVEFCFDYLNLDIGKHLNYSRDFYRPQEIYYSKSSPQKIWNDLNWRATTNIFEIMKKLIDIEKNAYQE